MPSSPFLQSNSSFRHAERRTADRFHCQRGYIVLSPSTIAVRNLHACLKFMVEVYGDPGRRRRWKKSRMWLCVVGDTVDQRGYSITHIRTFISIHIEKGILEGGFQPSLTRLRVYLKPFASLSDYVWNRLCELEFAPKIHTRSSAQRCQWNRIRRSSVYFKCRAMRYFGTWHRQVTKFTPSVVLTCQKSHTIKTDYVLVRARDNRKSPYAIFFCEERHGA